MTDEQQKRLAVIVFIDSERLDELSEIVTNLIERMADGGDDFDGRANWLRSGAEQLSAGAVDLAKEREELRKSFGLT